MAEITNKKTRMYEPWGYQEENNYQSEENILIGDLDSFLVDASYDSSDKKIHFTNKDGEEKATIDVTEFSSSIIESVNYDKVTKILTIKFSNGDVIEINLAELIDENEFADGLQVNDGIVSILIDNSGEPYLSVGEDGLKISGIDAAISNAVDEEKTRAEEAENSLDERITQVTSGISGAVEVIAAISGMVEANSQAISDEISNREAAVSAEESRAKAAEEALQASVTAEITRATQTEQGLNHRIDLVNDELDAEESVRESNDAALNLRITTEINDEKSRAISAETALGNQISELVGDLQPILNDTLETTNENEVAFGKYNVSHTSSDSSSKTVLTIGVGTDNENRKNAFEVRENGDVYMWVENDYMNVNRLLSMLAHEVYDSDESNILP
jgi:hypothetical protein